MIVDVREISPPIVLIEAKPDDAGHVHRVLLIRKGLVSKRTALLIGRALAKV